MKPMRKEVFVQNIQNLKNNNHNDDNDDRSSQAVRSLQCCSTNSCIFERRSSQRTSSMFVMGCRLFGDV